MCLHQKADWKVEQRVKDLADQAIVGIENPAETFGKLISFPQMRMIDVSRAEMLMVERRLTFVACVVGCGQNPFAKMRTTVQFCHRFAEMDASGTLQLRETDRAVKLVDGR